MDPTSSPTTQHRVGQDVHTPIHLQIPTVPTFPLSSPIVEEVMTPFSESDSSERAAGRSNNPFRFPEGYLVAEANDFGDGHQGLHSNNQNSAAHFEQHGLPRSFESTPPKKMRPGLNVVTDFSRNGFSQTAKDDVAASRQPPSKAFLDLNDLKSLSQTQRPSERQASGWQPTWKSKLRGYEELKDQSADLSNNPPKRKRAEKESLMRKLSRKAIKKPAKVQELSPSDRPILIGISVPAVSVNQSSPEDLTVPTNQQTPATPSIVITPAVEERAWDTTWDSSNSTPPRPASSVYSQPTPFVRSGRIESIPPVPAIPPPNSVWHNEKDGEPLVDGLSERSRKRRSYSAGTVIDEELSPSGFSLRQRSFSNESKLSRSKRLSLETVSTRRRSQGWWNVLWTPSLTRSNTLSSWRGPASDASSPPPVPTLSAEPKEPYSRSTINEKQWTPVRSAFSPDTPESGTGKRILSDITAWPDMDDWDKEREDRSRVPRSLHSPKIPNNKASPMSASSTQSIPLVMSTSTNHAATFHNMPCQHDLLSSQPCSTCLTRTNIDRFLAQTASESRGTSTDYPGTVYVFTRPTARQPILSEVCRKFTE
ncbi:predicted protein [Uncinocarpus reesii 1704]|uniref:Uncharacterized protein n=1 Tax=Uncinocarpus reesii (strain UAMH 1704) TaxID=336963 RepID=C4JHL2_UNCRE|nr:uncharacterized protein UREG_01375 [Uncinocarpus reesii 1704]EEP76526.1 predicted protein [Uncinocarpus reesii 1704]